MRTLYLLFILTNIPVSQLLAETLSPPTVTSTTVSDTCTQGVGAINLTVSGDFPPFTFQWSNGETTEDLVDVSTGDYNVIVTNANGESTTHFVTVQDFTITINFTVESTQNTGCNDLVNGSAWVILDPPIPGVTYLWHFGETTQSIQNVPGGWNSVKVSLGSCSTYKKFVIFDLIYLPSTTSTSSNSTCDLSNGGINLNVHGELEPYLFEWSTGETTEDLSGVLAGSYSVTVTGYNGCTHTNTFEVSNTNPPIPFSGQVSPNSFCQPFNGSINLSTSPPSGYTFTWSNGATTEDLTGLEEGVYEVTVTGQGTCTSSASYEVVSNAVPIEIEIAPTQPSCGQNNGQLFVKVLNGLPGFAYDWEHLPGTHNTPLVSNVGPGTYTVTVSSFGCSSVASVTLVNTNPLAISGTALPNTSCVTPNGSIDISVPPANQYTYAWSNGASTQDLSNLVSGIYAVTITDSLGCASTFVDTVVNNSSAPNLAIAATANTSCITVNGGINVNVLPAGVYTFLWSNGATTQNLANVPPGIYAVTVRDTLGCITSVQDTVQDQTVLPVLTTVASPNTACITLNGSIDVSVLPVGSYAFLWSNSATTEDLSSVTAGNYSLTVSDANGCTVTITTSIPDETSAPGLAASTTAAICGLANGSADLTASGGTAPYLFNWSNGTTTEDLANALPGNYAITITDANGCSAISTLSIDNNSTSFSLAGAALPNNNCAAVNGSVDLTVSPAGTYTFLWSNGETTEDLDNLPSGTYTVQVTESGSCAASATYVVTNDLDQPNLTHAITNEICKLSDGAIDLTVQGGQSPFSFSWSGGYTTEDLSGIAGGNYTVTVTDANQCTVEAVVTVPESTIPFTLATTSAPNSFCNLPNGNIDLQVTPLTGIYSYLWSNGSSDQDLNGIAAGSYTVTVSAGGACTSTASLVVGSAPLLAAGGIGVDVVCRGANTGAIDLVVNGGSQPYTFSWSSALGNVEDPVDLVAGNYVVTITDAGACTTTASFNIQQPGTAVQMTCSVLNMVSQSGSLDGTAEIQMDGGAAPYTVWLNPGGIQTGINPGNLAFNNLGVGDYEVMLTDAFGCTTECGFNMAQMNCISATGTMGGTLVELCGAECFSANYDPSGQISGPDAQLQFVLHEGAGTTIVGEVARSNQPSFCFDPATMIYDYVYYISAVVGNLDGDGNILLDDGCTSVSAGSPFIFYEKPVANTSISAPLTCVKEQVDIFGSSSLTGSTYHWTTQNGTILSNPNQAIISVEQAGVYALTVGKTGCFDTTLVEVTDIRNNPQASISSGQTDVLDCVTREILLTGASQGSNHARTIWFDANGTMLPTGNTLSIDVPGTYQFVVLDTLSFCKDTASITIQQNQVSPTLSINQPDLITCDISTVTLSGSSPVPGILLEWVMVAGPDTTSIGSGTEVSVSQPGDYLLMAIDPENGCSNVLGVAVAADQNIPAVDAGPSANLDCISQTRTLNAAASGGSGALSYQWTGATGSVVSGGNTLSPVVNAPGTYTLLVTSTINGCSASDSVLITQKELVASFALEQPDCARNTGSILIQTVLDATLPIQYTLQGGSQQASDNLFSNLTPGDYTVEIEDADGCTTSVSATIDPAPSFQITVEPQITISLGESYQIDPSVNIDPSEIAQVIWTPATGLSCSTCLSTMVEMPMTTQQYRLEVMTKAGCRDDATLILKVDKQVNVYIPNIFSPNGDGENEGFTVFAEWSGVRSIKTFQIFSRWGEQIFVRENFPPNDPALGWDGRFKGVEMNPGVFVYYALVELVNGQEVVYKGDVTLMR